MPTSTPSRVCARGHLVAGRDRNYRGDCLACNRLRDHGVEPLSGPRAKWNPYYANLPCPSCGSTHTVPFDPRPERAGRPPSSGLGTCVSCGHTWPASSLPVGTDGSPRPAIGRDDGGLAASPRKRTPTAALPNGRGAPTSVTDAGEPNTPRRRRNVPAATGTDGV